MDLHEPAYRDFVIHQLPLGQLEYLWSLYTIAKNPVLSDPITDQEIEEFASNLPAKFCRE